MLTKEVLVGVDIVFFDGAGQTAQLDQPAVVHHQGVDVPTCKDLNTAKQRPSRLQLSNIAHWVCNH